MSIENEHLANSVILEIGSGRGDTTRRLVDLLTGQPGSRLIVTDISDKYFQQLRDEFQTKDVQIQFIRTGAHELHEIPDHSVDYLVCNYTLCAVNSQAGLAALALRRFWEVLKSGGRLFVEEEFPVNKPDTPAQEIWAEKWRILKSAMILAGKFPYNEIEPETLEGLCRITGFEDIHWTSHIETYRNANVLDFFQMRLEALLTQLPNESVRAGFAELATTLHKKAVQAGNVMEVPFYRLTAQKRAG
uniref:Class I SAM-dependent methyltransferase n=1 Tax=Oscillatoriales cyanobacterium SpSt-402 TaxID=2282168 RepID=A0A832H5D0_9CYAN